MKKKNRDILQILIAKCENVSVLDLISRYIELKKVGKNYQGFCPWHTDNHPSLIVCDSKNIWKCFVCQGKGGGPVRFIQEYYKLDFLDAILRMSDYYNFESSDIIDDIRQDLNKKKYKKIYKKIYKKPSIIKHKINNEKKQVADIKDLNNIYNIFSDCCPLTISDYKTLKEERKLSDEVIRHNYFTFPNRKVMQKFIKRLNKNGYKDTILDGVPGFFKNEKGLYTFDGYNAIGRKIRNAKGLVQAIQLRTYKKIHNQRYFWFSSSLSVSSGTPADVVYPKIIKNPIICITEGSFKAEKLAENNLITISIQGVGNWQCILKEIRYILKKSEYLEVLKRYEKFLKQKNKKDKRIPFYICFDSDMIQNFRVFNHAKNMSDCLLKEFKNINPLYISWDGRLGKGIDDLIINNSNNMRYIKKFEKTQFDIVYSKIEEKLLKEHIEYQGSIEKVPKEMMLKYFNLCFKTQEYSLK